MKKWMTWAVVPVILAALVPVVALAKDDVTRLACGRSENQPPHQEKMQHKSQLQEGRQESRNVKTEASQVKAFAGQQVMFSEADQARLADARMAMADKNYVQAANLYEEVLKNEPKAEKQVNTVLRPLAQAYLQQGEFEKALERVEQAITQNPVNTKLMFIKAQALEGKKDHKAAMEQYFMFSALDSADTSALESARRGEALFRILGKRLDGAQFSYLEGLRWMAWQQPQKALPLLESFVATNPSDVNARMFLGLAHRQLNQPVAAIEQFQAITKAEPTSPAGFYQLGLTYDVTGDHKKAKQAWDTFMKYAPQTEATQFWVGPDWSKGLPTGQPEAKNFENN